MVAAGDMAVTRKQPKKTLKLEALHHKSPLAILHNLPPDLRKFRTPRGLISLNLL
jgi:hypothetical protein